MRARVTPEMLAAAMRAFESYSPRMRHLKEPRWRASEKFGLQAAIEAALEVAAPPRGRQPKSRSGGRPG